MDVVKTVVNYIKNTDLYLAILALVCSAYGMVLIYSATLNPATWQDGSTRNLVIQAAAIVIGLAAFVLMSLIDLETMSGWWKIFVLINIGLQLLLFTPLGTEVNGQRAWLDLEVTNLQPGELGKLIFIFTLAAHISEIKEHISEWRGLFVIALHTLIMMGAVIISSGDTGMAIQYFMIALIMLFAAGLSLKWLAVGVGLGVASIPLLWNFALDEYQKTRILVLFDPSIDLDASRQATYGKIAIGSGQVSGQGLTHGTMTQMQLVPENQTDYIFSVAGEELGFIGAAMILFLFALLIIRGYWLALHARDRFGALLIVGVTTQVAVQVFLNIGVVTNLIPPTGISLPFFSYGGTALVIQLVEMGIVLSVSRQIPAPKAG